MADTPPLPTETPEGVPIPAFTPWTGERRRDSGWTPHVQWLFIAALTRLGCVAPKRNAWTGLPDPTSAQWLAIASASPLIAALRLGSPSRWPFFRRFVSSDQMWTLPHAPESIGEWLMRCIN